MAAASCESASRRRWGLEQNLMNKLYLNTLVVASIAVLICASGCSSIEDKALKSQCSSYTEELSLNNENLATCIEDGSYRTRLSRIIELRKDKAKELQRKDFNAHKGILIPSDIDLKSFKEIDSFSETSLVKSIGCFNSGGSPSILRPDIGYYLFPKESKTKLQYFEFNGFGTISYYEGNQILEKPMKALGNWQLMTLGLSKSSLVHSKSKDIYNVGIDLLNGYQVRFLQRCFPHCKGKFYLKLSDSAEKLNPELDCQKYKVKRLEIIGAVLDKV